MLNIEPIFTIQLVSFETSYVKDIRFIAQEQLNV